MRLSEEQYAQLLERVPGLRQPVATTEAQLQAQLRLVCKRLGLLHYHTYRSKRSEPGFPDSVIVAPEGGTLWMLELKRDGETPSADQRRWLQALAQVTTVHSRVLTPATLSEWVQSIKGEQM